MTRRLVDVNELHDYIGTPVGVLYKWVSQRKIPFVKLGRSTKFDLQVIDGWIKQNSIQPLSCKKLWNEIK